MQSLEFASLMTVFMKIEETISQVPSGKGGDTSDRKKNPALARQNLLAWTDGVLAEYAPRFMAYVV